jgi:dipeptidyl-peptidase-4
MVVHGTGDDNVHYQGTEALINALVKANKQFSLMSYPNRSHSISEGAGTTRHLYSLFTRFLNEKLPPGPRGS